MLIYGLMKYVELAPDRYEKIMNLLTFGRHARSQQLLLSKVSPGQSVLDIGCGPGALALQCAERGAGVVGLDASQQMLSAFKRNLENPENSHLCDRVRLVECGSASMDVKLGNERFDVIFASLILGELSRDMRIRTMKLAARMLKPNGRLYVCDELWPKDKVMNIVYMVLFILFIIPNFILTRTLVRPMRNYPEDLKQSGLKVLESTKMLAGVITVLTLVPDQKSQVVK
jgi:ubiquinone/menaquinone biosynthesis C-methylase UbiE